MHETWLRRQRFDDSHTVAAFDHHFDAVLTATAARDRLDEQILQVAALPRFADTVNRLGCLRGISALTGLALRVEIGDWTRFSGSSIGAYVGLVPTEYSSGTSRVQGSITKAGNATGPPADADGAGTTTASGTARSTPAEPPEPASPPRTPRRDPSDPPDVSDPDTADTADSDSEASTPP